MTSKEIRNQFLEFFKNKEHKIVQSSPVVPYDDPTLLFTNAGISLRMFFSDKASVITLELPIHKNAFELAGNTTIWKKSGKILTIILFLKC